MVVDQLDRRSAGDVGHIERVECLAAEVEAGLGEQVVGERIGVLLCGANTTAVSFQT